MTKKNDSHKYCEHCKNNLPFVLPNELFEALTNNKLVIFAGAGISTENKSAFPYTLYEVILDEMGYSPQNNVTFSKLMSDYCVKTGGKNEIIERIKERIDYASSFPDLYTNTVEFHKQLAIIPCITEIVTTNWDDFFERECHATPFSYDKDMVFWENTSRKVLKLHGSINNLGSLIVTEEDYNEQYKALNTGLIGSQLKVLFANRRIVFIGYSFGDEDFSGIYSFVRSQLGDFMKKPYIVTLDKSNDKKWRELGLIPIYTAGAFFLHTIGKKLEKKGCLVSNNDILEIYKELDRVIDLHHKLTHIIDLNKYPEGIYCLSYQDGLIHALNHFLSHINYGESLCKNTIKQILLSYERIKDKNKTQKRWWDVAYVEGYINGHLFVLANDKERKIIPYYINLGLDDIFRDVKEYLDSLDVSDGRRKSISKFAIDFVKRKIPDKSIVPQHTPFL